MRLMRAWLICAAMVALIAAPSLAQITQGRLAGTATDAQGAVLPGVTVTVTSGGLIGSRSTVTQADGKYLFPALPSGAYKITFDLEGFKQTIRENIQVSLGQTITADAQLQLGTLSENVTVTGAAPVVDVTTTKVGTDMKGDQLIAVPNSSDVWGALSEAAGIRMQGFDVGGSHKSQQSGYESFGIQNQAKVVSDGVDHTEGVGGTGFYEDYYANEEVSVSSLGSDVEMSSPGASIVTTIKSGGNTFKGLENFAYEPGKFVGTNGAPSDISNRGFVCPKDGTGAISCNNPVLLFWEGHVDLGGPIAKDRLWFYGAYNQFHVDKQVSGVAQSVATDVGLFNNETAKGTAKLSKNNTLIGYFQRGQKQKPFRNLSTLVPPESILAQNSASEMYKGELQTVLSDRAFLDVNVGRFTEAWPMVPAVDPAVRIPATYRSDGSITGAGWNAFTTTRSKPQVRAQLTYYVPSKGGSHDLKFGFEQIYDNYHFGINGQSGPYRLSYATPTSPSPDRIRFIDTGTASTYDNGWTAGPSTDMHYSGYFQDRWAPNNRLSISAGLRFEYQDVGYGDATRKPQICDATTPVQTGDGGSIFPCSTTVTGASLLSKANAALRLGFSYNVDGKGKSVLKGFYGRYYNNIADGFSSANPGGQRYAEYNFIDFYKDGKYHDVKNLGTFRTRLGGADAPVDPNSKIPHTDEISATFEQQFWDESSLRLTYVRKMQKDFLPFYSTPIVTAWLGNVNVPTTASFNGVTYNLLDVPNSLANNTGSSYTNYPGGDFTYDTIEVGFKKNMGRAFLQGSFDYQWRDELRDASQVSGSPLTADPISVFPQISVNPNAPNRQKTTMYHAQVSGHYSFAYDIGVGINYRLQSGFPYSLVVPDGSVNLNVCNFGCAFFNSNLDQNRSESVNLLNFRIDKSIKVAGRAKAMVMLDIYNLMNADPVTNFNLNVGSPRTVIAVLDPRVFQLGFRLEF